MIAYHGTYDIEDGDKETYVDLKRIKMIGLESVGRVAAAGALAEPPRRGDKCKAEFKNR